MTVSLVFFIGRKLAHFVKEFEAYAPEVSELDPETETRDAIIRNPLCPDDDREAMYIEFGDELTVYWHGHSHFSPEDYWYDMMVEFVHDILDGKCFAAEVTDSAGKVPAVLISRLDPDECTTAAELFGDSLPENSVSCRVFVWGKEPFEIPIK